MNHSEDLFIIFDKQLCMFYYLVNMETVISGS